MQQKNGQTRRTRWKISQPASSVPLSSTAWVCRDKSDHEKIYSRKMLTFTNNFWPSNLSTKFKCSRKGSCRIENSCWDEMKVNFFSYPWENTFWVLARISHHKRHTEFSYRWCTIILAMIGRVFKTKAGELWKISLGNVICAMRFVLFCETTSIGMLEHKKT